MSDIDTTQVEAQAQPEATPPQQTEIRNPDAVLKALEAERQQRKELEKQLKAFQGVDVSKYQEYTAAEQKRAEEKAEAEKKALEAKGAYEALTAKQREEHQRELKAIQDQIDALKQEKEAIASQAKQKDSAISAMKLESKALKAFIQESGEEADFHEFVWPRLSKHVIETVDGGIQIVKENGDLWKDAKGSPLEGMRALFATFREGRGGKFFKPSIEAEGGGFVPQKGQSTAAVKTITREQAANRHFLVKNGISLEDISKGKVVVDFDS